MTEWIEIGRIVGARGLHGEMRVQPSTDFPERFEQPGRRWLQHRDRDPEPVELLRGSFVSGKGIYLIELAGVDYRDQAEALKGALLLVPANDRPLLEPDEFHVADLIGLTVVLQATGEAVGTVADLYEAGNDLLAIAPLNTPDRPPALVPFVKEIVPVVDLANGRIELAPPPGLLDL